MQHPLPSRIAEWSKNGPKVLTDLKRVGYEYGRMVKTADLKSEAVFTDAGPSKRQEGGRVPLRRGQNPRVSESRGKDSGAGERTHLEILWFVHRCVLGASWWRVFKW